MRSFLLATVVGLFLLVAGSASAAPSVTGIFNLPEEANRVAFGPDGNIWVTLASAATPVARVSPDGTVTPFFSPDIPNPVGITAGPDGNLWVTGGTYVGYFSPANPADSVKTSVATLNAPNDITVGPDGKLWTASATKVYRVTPAAVPTVDEFPSNVVGFDARGIAASTDGKIWVANGGTTPGILPVSTAGVAGTIVASADSTAKVMDVAAGPGGQMAYTQPVGDVQQIGLINGGAITKTTPTPAKDPTGITLGQDGAYWMAQFNSASVGRYTTDGQYTEITGLPTGGRRITKGPNNTLWVMYDLATGKKVVRISGVEDPDTTPPVFSKVSLTNKTFKIGSKQTALVAKKKKKETPTGTTLKYTVSEAMTTGIVIHKSVPGRKSKGNCVKPTAKLKKAKKCKRWAVVKPLFSRPAVIGANTFKFTGRFGKTKLKPGKYRFVLFGQDAKGNGAKEAIANFTVVAK